MKELTTYLNFDGNCRQAMTFYEKCLGVEFELSPFPDAQGRPPSDPSASIIHARLSRQGQALLMASDTPPDGDSLRLGNNCSVMIQCESIGEIERMSTALGQNGQVLMPLADMFWGARFGMLTDQFGIQWLFNYDLPQQKPE
jgi:PhnB protein